MRRNAVLGGTFAIVLTVGLIGALLLPASSQETIRVYEIQRKGFDKFINVDGKGPAGDYVVSTDPLYRAGTKKRVGRLVAQLLIMRKSGLFRASATFKLGKGRIEASGSARFGKLEDGAAFSVTGGTGAYEGASGTLVVRERKGRTFFTFTLNP